MNNIFRSCVAALLIFSAVCQAQWKPAGGPNNGNALSFAYTVNLIYAGTKWEGIYRSDDLGNSWTRMTTYGMGDSSVNAMVTDGSGRVYAGTNDGFYVWNTVGMWQKIFLDGKVVRDVQRSDSELWIATNAGPCVVKVLFNGFDIAWLTAVDTVFKTQSHDNSNPMNYELPSTLTDAKSIAPGYVTNGNRLFGWDGLKQKWQVVCKPFGPGLTPINCSNLAKETGSGFIATDNGYFNGLPGGSLPGDNEWITYPNYPNIITYKLLTRGTRIYSAGNNGVFVSDNAGTSWTPLNNQLSSFDVKDMIVHGASGNELMVATSGDGIFKLEPGPIKWKSTGFSKSRVQCTGVFGQDLYAGTYTGRPSLSVANNLSFGSINWKNCQSGLPPNSSGLSVYSLAYLDTGDVVLAGTSQGVFSSTNRGQTWGLAGPAAGNISAMAMASKGMKVCAVSYGTVQLSLNNGVSWSNVTNNLPFISINGVAFDSFGNIFLATSGGVYMSGDEGLTWAPRGLSGSTVNSITTASGKIFAGTYGNLHVSSNFGGSWSTYSNGLNGIDPVNSIAIKGNQIFLATGNKVFFNSLSNGIWTELSPGTLPSTVKSISVSDSVLFAGTNGNGVWKHSSLNLTANQEILGNADEIGIFPNPGAGQVFIQSKTDLIQSISIMDMLGRNVKSEYFQNPPKLIPVSLPKGIYVVQILHQGKISNRKISIE